jgi:hypothetical protein
MCPTTGHPNELFICIDNLRPELHCDADSMITSPNIDVTRRIPIKTTT